MKNAARPTSSHPTDVAPLQHEPRRIRPPFNMDGYEPVDHQLPGETAEQWRARRHAERVAALLEALDGVELGAYDRRIIGWLADWDTSVIGTIASLIYRARATDTSGGTK
jgi:hypothetical protein